MKRIKYQEWDKIFLPYLGFGTMEASDAAKLSEAAASPCSSSSSGKMTAPYSYICALWRIRVLLLDADQKLNLDEVEYYDASIDDKDQQWANSQRQGRKTDAVLSCPACFTTLCLDCQRHEIYVTQYRAMFVRNCRIKENVKVQFPLQTSRKRKSRGAQLVECVFNDEEAYSPVCCSICDTEVAVIDKDEVYHFFNIIPSYS